MPEHKTREVRIRMYRQGLGDCFLLTFPRDPRPFHMLIDCGALDSKHYDEALMKKVVRDIQKATRGHLDVVVATHEHWDHISGFSQAREIFDDPPMHIGEVWVAWTEDPKSDAARLIKDEFKKRKMAVEMALARLPDDEKNRQLSLYREAITGLLGFFGGLAAGGGKGRTEEAWDYILSRSRTVYCDPQKKRPVELHAAGGVRVYVLGPPEDPEYIRKRQSTKETYQGSERGLSLFDSFLAAVAGEAADPDIRARAFPFEERYRIPAEKAQAMAFFRKHYGFAQGDAGEAWRRIDDDWLSLAGELALNLDSYTNNICLALAIELVESGKVLLFPGDAQVGNWLSWGKLSWKVKGAGGETQTVTTDDLLARTVLYKVGHHGSHNATLRARGLEKMESPDLVAMIPVHRPTADDQDWEFPYQVLWRELKEKARGRVLLADAAGIGEIAQEAQERLSPDEWARFQQAVEFTELYVEYRIAC